MENFESEYVATRGRDGVTLVPREMYHGGAYTRYFAESKTSDNQPAMANDQHEEGAICTAVTSEMYLDGTYPRYAEGSKVTGNTSPEDVQIRQWCVEQAVKSGGDVVATADGIYNWVKGT